MLRGAINHAASAAGTLLAGYVARVAVVVPFIIGFGFATAALSLLLVDRFGPRNAYLMIAAIFALLGLVGAVIVSGRENGKKVEPEAKTDASRTASKLVAEETSATAASALPFAVLGTVLSTLGPAPFLSLLGILGRNLPLVMLLGAAGVLVWPKSEPGIAAAHTGVAVFAAPNSKTVDTVHLRNMAMGTFIIGTILVGAGLSAALGAIPPALPAPFLIS